MENFFFGIVFGLGAYIAFIRYSQAYGQAFRIRVDPDCIHVDGKAFSRDKRTCVNVVMGDKDYDVFIESKGKSSSRVKLWSHKPLDTAKSYQAFMNELLRVSGVSKTESAYLGEGKKKKGTSGMAYLKYDNGRQMQDLYQSYGTSMAASANRGYGGQPGRRMGRGR